MRHRNVVLLTALLLAPLVLGLGPPAAAAQEPSPVAYVPPVDAPLADTVRPPTTPYGPGNRGIDYATDPGQPVTAAAPGVVVFAGRVGTGLHVVVRHGDGIRTSSSFLGGVTVRRGDHVDQGTPLGTAAGDGTPLHFGARAPTAIEGEDAYLDPLVLLGQTQAPDGARRAQAHLVADPHPERPLTEAEERDLLQRMLREVGHAARWAGGTAQATVEDKLQLARILLDDLVDLGVPIPAFLVVAAFRWQDEQATCTPADTPVPPPPTERRIVVLVGGLGSTTDHAAVLATDTDALGYDARRDVVRFSYRPGGGPSTPRDSEGDLDEAAQRLAAQIRAIAAANPGVAVDVIAHSQGGLVARAAVVLHGARPALLATLGTPHHGADLATAAVGLDLTMSGGAALDAATKAVAEPVAGLDLDERSIQQMSETSPFLQRLDAAPSPPPDETRIVSIAVRGDLVVANHRSRLEHAANAVITTTGSLNEHEGIPGAPATTVELRRALAGQGPTCRPLVDALADEAIGRQTSQLHDTIGLGATATALYADARTRRLLRR
jgi:pimeloyl-ACP methyl ester carboxylesterase